MLTYEQISHQDYRENVEANNVEINELTKKKDQLLMSLEGGQVVDNTGTLKQEILSFLNFDELTTEILHRLIDWIEVNVDGSLRIHYRFSAPPIE
jgi:site-specific DNA recombinase